MLRWCVLGFVAAVAIGWLGAQIHSSGHAPIGLVSLGIGIGLGVIVGGMAATLEVAGTKRLIVGTVALALVAVIFQHAWLYVEFRRQWQEARAKSPQVAMFRAEEPWSPGEYFAREATTRQVVLWCADAALIVIAATTTVIVWQRKGK